MEELSVREILFKARLPLMNKAVDAYSKRLNIIAKNIANVSTKGYIPKELKFEELLRSEEQKLSPAVTNERHIVLEDLNEPMRIENQPINPNESFAGESFVNVDKEMAKLAETQIRFRLVSKLIRRFFTGLNSAITGMREG